jgi:hypothetical protein
MHIVFVLREGILNAIKIARRCLWHTEVLLRLVNWNIKLVYLFLISFDNGENPYLTERKKPEAGGKCIMTNFVV